MQTRHHPQAVDPTTGGAAPAGGSAEGTRIVHSPYLSRHLDDVAERCAKSISSMLDETVRRHPGGGPKVRLAAA